ncbi:MAG: HAD-IIIC family phosphatase [Tepidisphaeraceae bacterium]
MGSSSIGKALDRRRLVVLLRAKRADLARALFDAIRDANPSGWDLPQSFERLHDWGRSQLLTAIDLLAGWFEKGDPLFRELFAGWVQSHIPSSLSEAGAPESYRPDQLVLSLKVGWGEVLKGECTASQLQILDRDLDLIISLLSQRPGRNLAILFIGDCIQFEIIAALLGPCAGARIAIHPTVLNDRVQPVLRNRVRTLRHDQFDIAFFSPFSHLYSAEYEELLKPKSAVWSAARIDRHVEGMLADVRQTVQAMQSHLACPIYVHNTAGTVQSFGAASGLVKNIASARTRSRARKMINRAVEALTQGEHARLLDENSVRRENSAFELGRVHLNSFAFHPTRLGVALARGPYFDAIYTAAYLAGRKVVVCDLDNTLWDGVVGDGPIRHLPERQRVLKELRNRGVLLSINSKNDPRRISWDAAVLGADDFVAPRINWESKPANMARIRDELNLKLKDFVFIDDRPDELERMHNAFPEIVTLNSTDSTNWRLLSHWQNSLPEQPDEDRTRLYRERVHRDEFVHSFVQNPTQIEDESAALSALRLSVKLKRAGKSELKRAVELINRTNQFNLCGTRTSVRDLAEGLGTDHAVITAEASDKFGTMGVVGVMLAQVRQDRVEIPIFVLSCRVFGFGIEYALLNSVKRVAPAQHAIVGHFKPTEFNEPCRKLYPSSGLKWNGQSWGGRVGELPDEPAWLTVHRELSA